jgi:competence protein ComEC
MAMSGPLGTARSGETITSNAASVVLRVTLEDGLRVLLPGDMDDVTLEELVADGTDLSADVLVFPHHGSLGTVSDERKFATTVCQVVKPGRVLFSVGRGSRARPTEEILRGVFDADPAVSVACTQLSSGCLNTDADLASELTHLNGLPAAGRIRCRSCAGSISFAADGAQTPDDARHQGYIDTVAKTPMCRLARPADH